MSCNSGIKEVYLFNSSDVVIKNGVIRMKRKYGKFTRPITKLIPNKNK